MGFCPSGNTCLKFVMVVVVLMLVNISLFSTNLNSIFFQHFMRLMKETCKWCNGTHNINFFHCFLQSWQWVRFIMPEHRQSVSQHSLAPQVETFANTAFPHLIHYISWWKCFVAICGVRASIFDWIFGDITSDESALW